MTKFTFRQKPISETERKVSTKPLRTKLLAGLGLATLASGALLLTHRFNWVLCPVYSLTGVPCPTCGMTRSWLHLLSGDAETAFQFHPLFLLAPFLALAFFFYRRKDGSVRKWLRTLTIVAFAALIAVWGYRMIAFFPEVEPMVWNESAPLRVLWLWVSNRLAG